MIQGGGPGQTLAMLTPNTQVLHYLICGSPGNYSAGDRVQLQLDFSQLSTAAEDMLLSFPMQRDE